MSDQNTPTSGPSGRIALHWQILIALALAVVVGLVANESTTIAGAALTEILGFFGGLFINALKMIVVPLIVASIIMGVRNMAGRENFGRVGGKTVGFYVATGLLAVVTGLVLVNVINPGGGESVKALSENMPDVSDQLARVEGRDAGDLVEVISRAIPDNVFAAAVNMELLALIFFSVVFGYFMARLKGAASETLTNLWSGIHDVMILITTWILKFAPYGVFALVGKALLTVPLGTLVEALAWFTLTVLLALATHFFVTLPLLLRFVGGLRPYAYYGRIMPAQLMAFSTASSSATLPVTLASARRAGISEGTTSFVLPLGATVNMDGTALFECVVVIFIAQAFGADLTLVDQFLVVVLALLTSIGVAGIPAASLVAITLILTVLGLPLEAIGLYIAVDRILDMCRTSVNVTSDLSVTALVARTEGESLAEVRAGETSGEAAA